jgi:threonylcarbamoyladenosine tRNA methylthiotransferase MtaB
MGVLWEEQNDGRWQGLTANYLRVYARTEADLTNRLTPARIEALEGEGVLGVPALS